MLCTIIVSDIQNNFCTQHVLLHVLPKEKLLTKIYLYIKVIPPVLDEERTEISIEMDIYSVTNIDELAMSFNAEVRINLQWTDPRHDYKHLKNNANFLGTYHILHYHVLDIFGPHSSTHLIRKCHHFPIPIYSRLCN